MFSYFQSAIQNVMPTIWSYGGFIDVPDETATIPRVDEPIEEIANYEGDYVQTDDVILIKEKTAEQQENVEDWDLEWPSDVESDVEEEVEQEEEEEDQREEEEEEDQKKEVEVKQEEEEESEYEW